MSRLTASTRPFVALVSGAALALVALVGALPAHAIPRTEVLGRAKVFANHPWRMTAANATASCSAKYKSLFVPGDYVGLPYDWGGFVSLFQFDQQIAQGYGGGSQPDDGILACTTGLDCSAYVSKCWGEGHFTTSSLAQISTVIPQAQALAGDVFNKAGKHVAMFSHKLANGDPIFYESAGYNVHINTYGGWSHVSGAVPLRYKNIEGQSAANPVGTIINPIAIASLPFTDSRDTRDSSSDVLDGCAAAPTKSESGREFVYKIELKQPGTLTASVSDDAGVDIDVHLYTSPNTNDCVARHDSSLSYKVDCGTYYVVADTFRGAKEYPGAYTLRVDFTPSTASCGSGPPSYSPLGTLGTPCAYPKNQQLPFCNPNVGATTCIYTSTSSFCSKGCKTNPDCAGVFANGCCADIGSGELYCLPQTLCGPSGPGDGGLGAVDVATAGDGANDPGAIPDTGNAADDGGVTAAGDRAGAADIGDAGGGNGKSSGDGGCSVGPTRRGRAGAPVSTPIPTLPLVALFALVALSRRRRRRTGA